MWVEVIREGIEVGDWMEVLFGIQKNGCCKGKVREIFRDTYNRPIRYRVRSSQQVVTKTCTKTDLRLVWPGVANPPPGLLSICFQRFTGLENPE